MVSLRHFAADRARHGAMARLLACKEQPWREWGRDPAVAQILDVVGDEVSVLGNGVPPAVTEFRRTRDPVKGLACVYLVQALVVGELERGGAATVSGEDGWRD
jgi:hypothetical protein